MGSYQIGHRQKCCDKKKKLLIWENRYLIESAPIPPLLCKLCAPVSALPLMLIYNRNLQEWKKARIVYKKGDVSDVKNYRLISILSCVAKLFKQLMRPILTISRNFYISEHQHGFRSGRSTLTNLVEFVTDVMTEVDRGFQVDNVYTRTSVMSLTESVTDYLY